MNVLLEDSRRLTGANLYWDGPGAIIDVCIEGAPTDELRENLIGHWSDAVQDLLKACGHGGEHTAQRLYQGGASLFVSAPIDALYSMCELNELAWKLAVQTCESGETDGVLTACAEDLARLLAEFQQERRPRLLALQQAAQQHGVPFLWDDDCVSVGFGSSCFSWPYEELPAVAEVQWDQASRIPVVLVTGTNGKSTTVRMASAIITAAGLRAGVTSTDFIRVGDQLVEEGDFSGTGGARQLLRHPQVEIAVLEVARGGLLRRGLGVEQADAALVTNVAEDHLGEYGIDTVADLLQAKFIVNKALGPETPLILNADDQGCVEQGSRIMADGSRWIWWFSTDPGHPLIRESRERVEAACWLDQGRLMSNAGHGGTERPITTVDEIPSSRNGLAVHNIRNAMGATLLSLALGLPDDAIAAGLADFGSNEADNPGRGNWFERDGISILIDFAHNEHGLRALAESVNAMNPERVVLTIGQAGDRSDELIRSYTRAAFSMSPGRLLVMEMPGYERGRALQEVPGLIREEAIKCGLEAASIEFFGSPTAAARNALENARKGDVLVLLALTQRREVLDLVHRFIDG